MLESILHTAVNAVMPIVLLILVGCWLRKKEFLTDDFLKIGNKLVFHVCLPAMLFVNVYSIESFTIIDWSFIVFCSLIVLILFLLGMFAAVTATPLPERKGVLAQCVFRSNFAIIGLPLAGAFGGETAMGVAAVVSAFNIPLFNMLAVIALTVFVKTPGQNKRSFFDVIGGILRNPLIIGVALGLISLCLREWQMQQFGRLVFSLQRDTRFLYNCLSYLKSMATPLGLIVLGGQFRFTAVKGMLREIAVGTVCRLFIAPLLGLGAAIVLSTCTDLLHCTNSEYASLIALFGTPVAVSSAVMAGQMGSDEQLATQLVMWTSIGSVVTIFLQVCVLMGCGLLTV